MGLQVRCWLAAVAFGWLLAVAGCAEQLGSESLQQQQGNQAKGEEEGSKATNLRSLKC
eukprot:COSAG03_NODE_20961_length_311_cov_0.726415_1_plen_57_part_01